MAIRLLPLLSLVFVGLISSVAAQPLRGPAAREQDKKIREAFASAFRGDHAAACLIARSGAPSVTEAFGTVRSRGINVTADTLFDIGTLARQFTAVAILKLSVAGRLDLDDRIDTHLADVPKRWRPVKIRYLLTHTSALPTEIDFVDTELEDRDLFIARVLEEEPAYRPGRHYADNAIGYAVAAAIVEIASGQSFEEFVTKQLFEPARMRRTGFVADPSLDLRRAADRVEPGQDPRPILDTAESGQHWGQRGNTGVASSVRDLQRWNLALARDAVLDDAHRTELYAEYVEGSAPGGRVATGKAGEVERISLAGRTRGFRSLYALYPMQDVLVVVLSDGRSDLDALGEQLDGIIRSVRVRASTLAAHVGRYRLDSHNEFDVVERDGALHIRSLGQEASARLYHGQPTMPEWPNFYDEVAERAPVLFRPLLQKDVASFARSFHPGAPKRAAAAAVDLVEKLEEQHGRAGRARLIGTRSAGAMSSWFLVQFGEVPVTLRVTWHGQDFHEVARDAEIFPLSVELTPGSDDKFSAMSIDGEHRLFVRFTGKRSGTPSRQLMWFDASKAGVRGLKCRRLDPRGRAR